MMSVKTHGRTLKNHHADGLVIKLLSSDWSELKIVAKALSRSDMFGHQVFQWLNTSEIDFLAIENSIKITYQYQ